MDQVKIRAAVAAHGLAKNDEVTVAATPTVEGAITNGVFVELDRIPSEPQEPQDGEDDEAPVPPVVDVDLPDAVDEPTTDEPAAPKSGSTRRRG